MTDESNGETTSRPTRKSNAIALAIGLVLSVVAVEGTLRLAMPHWREFFSGWFMQPVDVPGYGRVIIGRPGFDGHFAQNNGDFRIRIRINPFGLRNPEPIDKAGDRVWFIGDSLTFGWGVEQNEIYSSVAGRISGAPAYNVASPGANVCGYQALVARMPESSKPRAVILGLILENDVIKYDCRADITADAADGDGWRAPHLKKFLTRNTALYNFFAVSLKRVALINDALVALGLVAKSHDYPLELSAERLAPAVETTVVEIAKLRAMLPAGTPFAVLTVPTPFEIRDRDPFSRQLRTEVSTALAARGIAVIDPFQALLAAGFSPIYFRHDGHWAPLGHDIAGRAIAKWLRGQGLGS